MIEGYEKMTEVSDDLAERWGGEREGGRNASACGEVKKEAVG